MNGSEMGVSSDAAANTFRQFAENVRVSVSSGFDESLDAAVQVNQKFADWMASQPSANPVPDTSPLYFIGIDPGFKGGVVVIDRDKHVISAFKMPVIFGDDKRVDTNSLLKRINALQLSYLVAYIERMQPRRSEDVKNINSEHSMARHAGALIAVMDILQIPVIEVHPTIWQSQALIPGKLNKQAKQRIALDNIFDQESYNQLSGLPEGVHAAALIAEYGLRQIKLHQSGIF